MSPLEIAAVLLAGIAAGTINTIVGSGSLVTFPTLLLFGVPPLVANMSNTIGLIPGGVSGAHGYRRELAGQGRSLRRLVPAALAGGAVGGALLLVLPEAVFDAVVPVLILVGVVLVVAGPALQRRARAKHPDHTSRGQDRLLVALIFCTGIYGGYFGAAQGVILMGVMSALMTLDIQRINGIKNVLGLGANAIAALVFVVARFEAVDWWIVLYIGVGTLVGGVVGAGVGRRLPPPVLRTVIVVIGLVAIWHVTLGS